MNCEQFSSLLELYDGGGLNEAEKAEMRAVLEELRESSTCCGTYDLLDETTWASPDLADRIESAIKKARGEE